MIYRHGLRNALLPITTGLGLSLLATLSGSVAIELVFNRPGIGEVLISAIAKRDGTVLLFRGFWSSPLSGPFRQLGSYHLSGRDQRKICARLSAK